MNKIIIAFVLVFGASNVGLKLKALDVNFIATVLVAGSIVKSSTYQGLSRLNIPLMKKASVDTSFIAAQIPELIYFYFEIKTPFKHLLALLATRIGMKTVYDKASCHPRLQRKLMRYMSEIKAYCCISAGYWIAETIVQNGILFALFREIGLIQGLTLLT